MLLVLRDLAHLPLADHDIIRALSKLMALYAPPKVLNQPLQVELLYSKVQLKTPCPFTTEYRSSLVDYISADGADVFLVVGEEVEDRSVLLAPLGEVL